MKGHVPTPDALADKIVRKLFNDNPPTDGDRILYPGCGTGPFIAAVHRYCNTNDLPTPDGIGIELNPEHLGVARDSHADKDVELYERDFLNGEVSDLGEFDYIVGNPPYVPIEGLDEDEKQAYKARFDTAVGRFDLYILFFEQALNLLADGGRLSFITPEKFEYVGTAEPLRRILTTHHVEEIEHVDEDAFGDLITFPTITTLENSEPEKTRIVRRDGSEDMVELPSDGSSWASTIREGDVALESGVTLDDVTKRVSCGVATGADSVFVVDEDDVPPQLRGEWTYPTTSGKQLRINDGPDSGQVFISPYREDGRLVPEGELGEFGEWAELYRERLEDRSCVEKGKLWYAWHENPPMQDILQPKLVCKDITEEPHFWADETGEVVPRHSVYYIIPKDHVELGELQEYLNSAVAQAWIEANCQRAANGFLRMQSTVLKDLPVPQEMGQSHQATLTDM